MDFNKEFNKAAVLDFLKNQFLPDDFKVEPEIELMELKYLFNL